MLKRRENTQMDSRRSSCRRRGGAAALRVVGVAAVLLLAGNHLAGAADFTVTSTADLVDASIGDGICDAGGGECTLRAAILEANSLGGTNTISLPAGTYTLTIAGRNEDLAHTGDLDVRADLAITGAGAASTILRAGATPATGIDRLLHVHEVVLQLSGMTIANGKLVDGGAAGEGAGILNNGSLTLVRVRVRDCAATSAGGGIQTTGTATAVIGECLIDGNTGSDGGGLSVAGGAVVNASNVSVSGNLATTSLGGGITVGAGGTISLANATIVDNQTYGVIGGGINTAGTVNIKNSIVAANTNQMGTPGNCTGSVPVTSGGFNIDDGSTCNLGGSGDQSSVDPQLGSLADNGGFTPTHALAGGSPAVDGGNPAGCTSAQGDPLSVDQRGFARPRDGDENGSMVCDSGAFELHPVGSDLIFMDGFESGDTTEWTSTAP